MKNLRDNSKKKLKEREELYVYIDTEHTFIRYYT